MNNDKKILSRLLLTIAFLLTVSNAIGAQASAGSVTGYQKITWGISTGRYYVNGIHAFCAQYNKSWPTVGTAVNEIVPCTNEVLRKALYYGYNGPKNTLGTDEKSHVLTAIAVSDANIGEPETGASAKYDAFYWELVNNPSKYPSPPSNFKAYLAITASDAMQNLAFYEMEKNGYVTGIKYSSNLQLHSGNSCYSLEGAEYGIYSSSSLDESTRVGVLATNANGEMNTLELEAGTYYARENVSPMGFAKSNEVTQFTITAEKTTTLTFTDDPQTNPIDILVRKIDADTNRNEPQGSAKLDGAHFRVQYYAGIWHKDEDPASLGQTPTRTWVFQTDENGIVRYHKAYLVTGSELYESMPLGTLVIQEIKASEGYLRNDTVYVRQITSSGEEMHVATYEAPTVAQTYIKLNLVISKSDNYGQKLKGAEFTLYEDEECLREVKSGTTDKNGILQFSGLALEKMYYLKETKAPAGYKLKVREDGDAVIYNIFTTSAPESNEFTCYVNGNKYENISGTDDNREVNIDIVNDVEFVLPKTGSNTTILMSMAGMALCGMSLYLHKKEKKQEKGEHVL
ncbi:MAG: LPXTG cell wall anchor domain-containing protein [Tyzzerella sp.]|nr:LPXTG cell wall anchor domain-containing protein [Tyzzerella sp.]